MRIKTYSQALKYLNSFINYERLIKFSYKKSLKLERASNLFKNLGINPQALKVIHIAGTKGKGSVSHFLAYILGAAGFRVGLYTSPHFNDFRERIKIVFSPQSRVHSQQSIVHSQQSIVHSQQSIAHSQQSIVHSPQSIVNSQQSTVYSPRSIVHSQQLRVKSKLIPQDEVVNLLNMMIPTLERLRFHRIYGQLSFFEVYTALAFKYFLKEKLDWAVLECGLGGRLDATNVCNSLISVITKIDYDHLSQLGTTLADIAFEKAGIIKDNSLVVSAEQRVSAKDVLKKKAKEMASKIYFYNKDFFAKNLRFNPEYTLFDYVSFLGSYKNLKIRLLGEHQVENASLAVFCFQLLKEKFNLDEEALFRGLKEVALEGRFQILRREGKTYILDVAHNPLSVRVLNLQIKKYFPSKKVILIFGCSKDKPPQKMLKEIDFDRLILTKANNPRAYEPQEIKQKSALKDCLISSSFKEAFEKAIEILDSQSIIVITGSFFLVAEALKMLN